MDPSANAFHKRAIQRVGEMITLQRISGAAPRAASFSATVKAVVRNYSSAPSDGGYGGAGAITEGGREIILLASDLADLRFPLPVQKNDKVILSSTGEKLNVIRVDTQKRAFAGAIELTGVGVA